MEITAACEVWKPGDCQSNEGGAGADEENMMSDTEARGSGDAICESGGSDAAPTPRNNIMAADISDNSPCQPPQRNGGDNMDPNANIN